MESLAKKPSIMVNPMDELAPLVKVQVSYPTSKRCPLVIGH